MKRDGFSLIELVVVMVIAGIVAAWGTVSYSRWRAKYDMENQIRQTYADLTSLRVMARTKSSPHFMAFAAGQVSAKEDTIVNGTWDAGDRTLCLWSRPTGQAADAACPDTQSVSIKTLKYPIIWSSTSTLRFDSRGLADQSDTICIDYGVTAQVNASYDCIDVTITRVALGSLINKGGACDSANCGKKE